MICYGSITIADHILQYGFFCIAYYFYMCRLSFQAQISVTLSTKSYLCLNNFVYGLDSQSMPFPPISFVEPLWF